jgi:DUF1680 family protein
MKTLVSLTCLLPLALLAEETPSIVLSKQQPLPVSALSAPGGFTGQRWQANLDGSLKKMDINRFAQMVEDRPQKTWWWIGEQPGKWLESSVISASLAKDEAFLADVKGVLERLKKAQAPDGYLGITSPSVITPEKPIRGMDPYEQYFTFHGLITAYEVLGDKAALEAAKKLGLYYVDHIGPGKAEFWPSPVRAPENKNLQVCAQQTWMPEGTKRSEPLYVHSDIAGHTAHYCWEGTLVIDPLLRLYQATGEKRILEWCQWVVSRMDTWSGWDAFSKLDDVAAGKLGVHQLQPYVHSHTFHMNFLGFLRLYQITGDVSYLRKVTGAWQDIVNRQLYITGGVSVGEHYTPDYLRPIDGHVVETCANMSWMELNQYLLELTGEAKYAEVMERLLVNHVFAAQTVDGDCYRYHTPPNGMKPSGFFHGPDCCTASGHRLTAKLPLFIYAQDKETAIVNQYVASSATFDLGKGQRVKIAQDTRYPETEHITLTIEPSNEKSFTLRLRMPAWCEKPGVSINGDRVKAVLPGRYLDLSRAWKKGDVVKLSLPMDVRWVAHDHLAPDQARWALMRGPVVYAVDTLWWDVTNTKTPSKIDDAVAYTKVSATGITEAKTPPGLMGPAFRARLMAGNGTLVQPLFVPFANVGVWYKPGAPKPDPNSNAYSYAVWLHDAENPRFKQAVKAEQELAELRRTAIDYVQISAAQSDKAHLPQGDFRDGRFNERTYRHGRQFSWLLEVSTEKPSDLVVTYWGGDVNRVFDVFVNETVVATQKLEQQHPDAFFDVRYPIPFEMVKDKTDAGGQKVNKVRVSFKSRNADVAGGVFGIRTELQK